MLTGPCIKKLTLFQYIIDNNLSHRHINMKKITVYQVDSFTTEKFKGNPAGVVPDAKGLTENEMQAIARELNNSETAFILPPESYGHEVRIRFFTPLVEVPSCGHATVAAHYIRAIENNFPSRTYNHKTGIGVLPVDIIKNDSDYKIFMTQGKPVFGDIINGDQRKIILSALHLDEDDIDSRAPFQIVDTGHSKVMIMIKNKTTLNNFKPDFAALKALSSKIKCNGYYVFTFDSDDKDILINGRMFAPAVGINEDPVTGNANGPAGAYIVKYNLTKVYDNRLYFTAKQGEAINRAGIIEVNVDVEDGNPARVKIGGNAAIVFKTEIEI
jgi:PhzF family phenazine biosynthesis protein